MIPSTLRAFRGLALLLFSMLAWADAGQAQPVTVTDLLGRTVTLPAPARKIVLGQGRQLNALGLIHPEPLALIAGMGNDFQRQNREAYALYRAKFPAIETIASVGDGSASGFSFEGAVAREPDLVILSLSITGRSRSSGDLLSRFEAAGIPVVVVDFYLQPLRDTVPSLRILGKLLAREAAAEDFIRFYEERRKRIAERLATAARPRVFMHVHAGGTDCCSSPGKGTLHEFIVAAGGTNIAAALLPGVSGQISLEQLIAEDPEIYVATGGTHLAKAGGFVLGLGISEPDARASFAHLLDQPGLQALSAVRSGRAHGLWQLFNDTPLHVVAIEAMAKWFHPALFADVDPKATLAEMARRFSAIPLDGALWVDAAAKAEPAKP